MHQEDELMQEEDGKRVEKMDWVWHDGGKRKEREMKAKGKVGKVGEDCVGVCVGQM